MRTACTRVFLLAVLWPLWCSRAAWVDGFSEPSLEIEIASPESGILVDLPVREGDRVAPGQVLAVLDSDVLRAELAIARAQSEGRGEIEALSAELELRRRRTEKLERLAETGAARPDELERARADRRIAEANLLKAEEQQAVARLHCARIEAKIERRTLRSPIQGVITAVHKEEAENVTVGDSRIMTLVQLDPISVTFYVPTRDAGRLSRAPEIRVVFEEQEEAVGQLGSLSPVTDPQSGTVRARVDLANPERRLQSGVRCRIEVPDTPADDSR
jgi:RND family efflux transporter MFP subunit